MSENATGTLAQALIDEHHEIDSGIEAFIKHASNNPDGASFARCRSMLEVLEKHNEKEEPVIYPHLDNELDPAAQARLQEFIASGSMPAGWVCRDA